MKKLLSLIFLFPIITFGQGFHWGYQTVESSNAIYPSGIKSIVTDHLGNVYATGFFHDTCDFDNSANNYFLTCSNTMWDGFVMKLDKYRNFIWAKQIVSLGNGQGNSIVLDQDENLIVTGLTSGFQIDLDPDPTSQYIVNSNGTTGGFIIKLNPDGNFISGSFTQNFFAKESVVDSQNNIITIGSKNGALCVVKSNTNQSVLWEQLIPGGNIFSRGIACDNLDNIIVTGNFQYSMSFGGNTYTSAPGGYGYTDFIYKLSPLGIDIWYQKLGSTGSAGISSEDKSVLVDNLNNIYFNSSYIDSTITFNGQTISFPYIFGSEVAIFKIDVNGNYIWSVPIYGDERQEIKSLAFNSVGDIYAYLFANDEAYIKDTSNAAAYQIYNSGMHRGILLQLNSNGNYVDSTIIPPNGISLFIDFEDNILIGGRLLGEQYDFDPGATSSYLMSAFRGCGYILKLGPCDNFMPDTTNIQTFCSSENATVGDLYPNTSITKWYSSPTSLVQLSNNLPLVNGQTYYVSKQVGSCPESPRAPVTVVINQNPAPPIVASNQVFCESDYATVIDASITFQPSALAIFYNAQTDGNIIYANTYLVNNVNYYVSQTVNGCESDRAAINATIIPSPTPTATSSQTFCIQQNATINDIAITGQNIKWYDASNGGNLLSSTAALQNGVTYYASQTLNSCESERISVTIQIQDTPAPTGNNPQTLCALQNPTLNNIAITGTAINWYSSNTSTTPISSNTLLVDGTTYFATQTVNGCESIGRLPLAVTLISSLNAVDSNAFICDNQNNGNEIVDLSLLNYHMASLAENTFTYYSSFNGADNQIVSEQLPTNHIISLGQTIVYVRIDNTNGCHQIVELELTLVSIPIITMPEEFAFCEGSSVTISAPPGFDLNIWSTNVNATSITLNQAGNYWLMVGNSYGNAACTSTKNFTVVLSNAPTITSIDTVDWTDNENSITVNTSGLGDYEYSIDGANFQSSNVFSGLPNGAYLVTVRDKNECGTDTEQVFLLNYPKFFTPNSDGNNDGWSIKFSQFEPNFEVRIFDRYGKLLRIMSNDEAWDGNYNGRQLPSDDYWFTVTRNDGRIHKGHFAMLR